jgi:penicillin amidase
MLRRSLETAVSALAARYGSDVTEWRWGAAHRATFTHPLLSKIPLLARLSDISIETDGGNYTVNRGASHIGPVDALAEEVVFPHRHGASLRAIYDLENLDRSRYMIATGQSGNPLSPLYDQFVKPWRQGHFITLRGNREELRASSLGTLHLRPKSHDQR